MAPRIRLLLAGWLVAWPLVGTGWGIDIAACGVVVPERSTGVLQTDLSGCSTAVVLERNAVLQMNGHTISGSTVYAVECRGRHCTVVGPGEIAGGSAGIISTYPRNGRRMMVQGISIHDTDAALGVNAAVVATDVTIANNCFGNPAPTSSIAMHARSIVATNLQVTGNAGFGLFCESRTRLTDSTLTGNNGFGEGIDFLSRRRPMLVNSTCGMSTGAGVADTAAWGVCTNDAVP